jgi:hypothetical protein
VISIVVEYCVDLDLSVMANSTEHLQRAIDYLSNDFQKDLRKSLKGDASPSRAMMVEHIVMNHSVSIVARDYGAAPEDDAYDGLYSNATIWGIPVEALVIFCVFECCCLAVCIGFVCGYLRGKMTKRRQLQSFSDKLARALRLSAANTTMTKLKPPSPPLGGRDDAIEREHRIQRLEQELKRARGQSGTSLTIQSVVEALNQSAAERESSGTPPPLPPPTMSNSNNTSVDTVASVASGATSPSITSMLCHRPPTAPPSRVTSTTKASEGYERRHASKATMGFYKTTLPVLISEIDLDSESNDSSAMGDVDDSKNNSDSEGLYSNTTTMKLAGSSIVYANI